MILHVNIRTLLDELFHICDASVLASLMQR